VIQARKLRDLTIDSPRGSRGGHYVSAASGLVRTGRRIYVAADDERELAVFPAEGDAAGRLVRFLPGELPADPDQRKRHKPDVEALALLPSHPEAPGGALLALESGSKPNRRGGVWWALDPDGELTGEPRRLELEPLYGELENEIPSLNVEGATVAGRSLLLFQRGNGRGGVNAVVELDLRAALRSLDDRALPPAAVVRITRHDLGEVDGVRLCFSDATALPDAGVLFTAVAEGGEDTYRDGHCAGAAAGLLAPNGELAWIRPLDPVAKVEGIEARRRGAQVDILMVADPDDPAVPAPLLGASLRLA
jgi:hypothetical protein